MSYQLKREKLCEGVHFSCVTDAKFKHNRITVHLVTPLDRKTVTSNAIVPFLLRKGCRSCPDFTHLNRRLCELYGAALSCDVSKLGWAQVLELSIYGIDDRFTLDGGEMTAPCASLLAEVLLEPALVDGLFRAEDVELEKQQVIDAIESLLNDKRSYALSRCRSIMCEGEPCAIEKYGDIDEARALTPEKATAAYKALLESAQVEIMFVGCGSPETARDVFARAFSGQKRSPVILPQIEMKKAGDVKEVEDAMDVAQGKLVLGFRAGAFKDEKELAAMRLMSALYGGTPSSRLFMYVREKLSLCYYCAARFDRLTGLMYVDSGVEFANREKAQEEILHQLEIVRAGEFSQEEIQAARLLLQNSLNAVTDSLGAIGDWYLAQILSGTNRSPADDGKLLEDVTAEQIMEMAGRTVLDTIYFLKAKEAE